MITLISSILYFEICALSTKVKNAVTSSLLSNIESYENDLWSSDEQVIMYNY